MRLYYPDTNVFLEGKPLAELPWAELATSDTVRLCVVPTVLREIDKKKRDGRLAERARSLNRLLGAAATSGQTIVVRDSQPRVEIFIARIGKLSVAELEDLDLTEPDVRIVAEVFAHADVDVTSKVVLSQDVRPLSVAYQLGLQTHHLSENWLAAREPSAAEREAARLNQRVRDLESTQPKFRIKIAGPVAPLAVCTFDALGAAEQHELHRKIVKANPEQSQGPLIVGYDHSYRDK